jgi:hypothetical protein
MILLLEFSNKRSHVLQSFGLALSQLGKLCHVGRVLRHKFEITTMTLGLTLTVCALVLALNAL